ncbi:cytochrome C biogenesis protein [Haloferax mediterranei ATCC 33500]|uniref:Cytochrome C biogenesis protein n=1 Tax=Haloferax mediterranei (strain ATCC 33500 / DSM 1411 / JCM 8866 / NBRC 14739 / NCIMB 2177 / R-4) TaxID=523841 RepID=I3R1X0_HALMT|nr:cytochrome c biogenesis protein CcdA [Haloferax mediterranei]AFK18230.1 cytochrome c-type biogenesis protein-like protein [Haloferax mediterranei ATCC 33500]AHZ22369.1 cytochrome C biogenesis protein [Haloferax mediterranei ATCC 33500]EMA02499.1 cytochrome c-type biogenesis protein-like protein [Haloferax mediterranei ATCC 33500]MDX5988318.1 cytochrome c biogenesis protein CcdA [Haloferax mediterranei ATCC 33500]QCQ74753.1 cytochrome C biogenesis protein [Haloferax mediterranei ATCC 33500]
MIGAETAGAATLALGAAVATFFSPCAYALLPGYVGYYVSSVDDDTEADVPVMGALVRGSAAFLGVVVVFALLSAGILLVGQSIEPVLGVLEPLVGVGLLVLGSVVLVGYSPNLHVQLPERRSSKLGFVLFGGGYAIAAAGCVAPVFLAIVLRAVTFPPAPALVVLGAYTAGFGVLLLGATVAIAVGHSGLLDWLGRRQRYLDAVAGVVLVSAGIWQVVVAL